MPRTRFTAPLLLIVVASDRAFACATCFGASDSAMAQGMNAGILSLLGFIGLVLAGVVAFFVTLAIRSARLTLAARAAGPGRGDSKPLQTR